MNNHVICNSFPICISFISFSCVTVARTASTMLIKSVEKRHPCFVPNYRGKTSSFSLLNMMLDEGFLFCFVLFLVHLDNLCLLICVFSPLTFLNYFKNILYFLGQSYAYSKN